MYDFSKHSLDCILDSERIQVYRLHRPRTRVGLVQITFSPEGIAIQGDVVPGGGNGVCSRGKDRAWFADDLAPRYLASKFLAEGMNPDLACEQIRSWVRGEDYPERIEDLDVDRLCMFAIDRDWHSLRDAMNDAGMDTSDGVPGFGYDPDAVETLSAIQRAFARLYRPEQPLPGDIPPGVGTP